MSHPYNGADSYPTSITLPDDLDAADAASVNVAIEGLADRTTNLNARETALDGRVGSLETDVGTLQTDVGTLQTDVGNLNDAVVWGVHAVAFSIGDVDVYGPVSGPRAWDVAALSNDPSGIASAVSGLQEHDWVFVHASSTMEISNGGASPSTGISVAMYANLGVFQFQIPGTPASSITVPANDLLFMRQSFVGGFEVGASLTSCDFGMGANLAVDEDLGFRSLAVTITVYRQRA